MTEEEEKMALDDKFNPFAQWNVLKHTRPDFSIKVLGKDEKNGHIYGFMLSWSERASQRETCE